MESIDYAVKVVAFLWILMVAFIAMFGANQSIKDDRLSRLFHWLWSVALNVNASHAPIHYAQEL